MKVRLHAEAKAELVAGAEWYEKEESGLGAEFVAEVLQALDLIGETANVWPLWPDAPPEHRIRRFVISRFPYQIAYSVGADVFIVAIAHSKRTPLYWIDRA